jgi:malonyl-CoA O-methyltransferase
MFIPEERETQKDHTAGRVAIPSVKRIARSFGRKAKSYDDHAPVQHDLIKRLVAMLEKSGMGNGRWVDCGCGTGLFARECRAAGMRISIVGVDIAFEPLLVGKKYAAATASIQAAINKLPVKNAAFDGAVLASTFQWLADPSCALARIAALLKPEGVLAFSVFTKGAFLELSTVQQQIGIPVPVNCPEADLFIDMARAAGFYDFKYEQVEKTIRFPTAAAAMKSISRIGGSATAVKPLQRGMLAEFCCAYEERFRTGEGVPLTCRAIVGVCRKGACL